MPSSFVSMFGMLGGDWSVINQDLSEPRLYIFYSILLVVWYTSVYVICLGLIIATLNHAFRVMKRQKKSHVTLEMRDDQVIQFFIKHLKKWIGITKPKPVRFNLYIINNLFYFIIVIFATLLKSESIF